MELAAKKRAVTGKGVKTLRDEGRMPAVVYGAKDSATPIEVSAKEFGKILKEAGESTVIALDVDGEKKNVLVHEVDRDPVTDLPRHADFYAIQKGQKVEVEVQLKYEGESPAVKQGLTLVKVMREIEIEADATMIPHEIVVNISGLAAVDDEIAVSDLPLPPGVTLVTKPDEIVAIIAEAKKEEEETPVEKIDMAAIGDAIEKKPKDKEEGALPPEA